MKNMVESLLSDAGKEIVKQQLANSADRLLGIEFLQQIEVKRQGPVCM
jgi:hypothetical protein